MIKMWYNVITKEQNTRSKMKEEKKMTNEIKNMLEYYGFETIEEFGKAYGFYNKMDAERFLKEKYKEDILWD